jgi:hypothetical protein
MNMPRKVDDVKRMIRTTKADVIGLMETQVKDGKMKSIQQKFGNHRQWVKNSTGDNKGRIWVGWRGDTVKLQVLNSHEQYIHCDRENLNLTYSTQCSLIYGANSLEGRNRLWRGRDTFLQNIRPGPWLCMGDFNTLLTFDDRINGRPVTPAEIRDFHEWIEDRELSVLRTRGTYFTWTNKSKGQDC